MPIIKWGILFLSLMPPLARGLTHLPSLVLVDVDMFLIHAVVQKVVTMETD
jgi:hypothetical protein